MRRVGAVIGMAMLVAGCVSSAPAPVPALPTPFPEIATTPELETWAINRILSYREAQHSELFIGLGLQILALPAALHSSETELVVTSAEPPPGWFVTPIGSEPVAIVVNVENPVRDLESAEVADIFTGKIDNWMELGGSNLAIQPVIPLEGAETRSYLQETLLGSRQFTSLSLLGPEPEAVLELVSEDLGAIGVVPLSTVSSEVGLLRISGQDPTHASYPWLMDILAIAPVEPGGVVRDWLGWLQASDEYMPPS